MGAAPAEAGGSRKAAVSFTGGKDSMTVLHMMLAPEVALSAVSNDAWRDDMRERLAQVAGYEVTLLVTFLPAGGKQSFKAHPLEVVQLQARALGLPHLLMEIESTPTSTFLDSYAANIRRLREEYDVTALATGDILDVCSSFMPRAAAGTGVELLRPLWGIDRAALLELVWAYDMSPLITCVNTTRFVVTAAAAPSGGAAAAPPAAGVASNVEGDAGKSEDGEVACAGGQGSAAAGDDGGGTAAGQEGEGHTGAERGAGAGDATALLLGSRLDRRLYNEVLLTAKKLYGVDEAGEWGEYHTMVTGSRLFTAPLRLSYEPRQEGDYAFLVVSEADLVQ
ncbi:hypothetical protein PLESTB_001586200 [Pleodorina starrii]|uniref:Diphthine--ammonia ligase n=1 Tax=Pleodorina starrii TaxID=330485 RepID=A0A9W6BXS9_9CHLO|nr:hypothetical protein PLESTB_001586200 [Pleodorina starrii]GLC65974.1 hypothetical protein PLESTF_000368200 [Pleodorina starrii]